MSTDRFWGPDHRLHSPFHKTLPKCILKCTGYRSLYSELFDLTPLTLVIPKVLKYCQSLNYVAPLKSELAPLKGEANFLIGITRVRGVKSKSSEYNRWSGPNLQTPTWKYGYNHFKIRIYRANCYIYWTRICALHMQYALFIQSFQNLFLWLTFIFNTCTRIIENLPTWEDLPTWKTILFLLFLSMNRILNIFNYFWFDLFHKESTWRRGGRKLHPGLWKIPTRLLENPTQG